MTGADMREARVKLAAMWGKSRPLSCVQMGRACRLGGKDPGESIRNYEAGVTKIGGPVSALVAMMLNGALPPDGIPR